jgi:hypothetical protein
MQILEKLVDRTIVPWLCFHVEPTNDERSIWRRGDDPIVQALVVYAPRKICRLATICNNLSIKIFAVLFATAFGSFLRGLSSPASRNGNYIPGQRFAS